MFKNRIIFSLVFGLSVCGFVYADEETALEVKDGAAQNDSSVKEDVPPVDEIFECPVIGNLLEDASLTQEAPDQDNANSDSNTLVEVKQDTVLDQIISTQDDVVATPDTVEQQPDDSQDSPTQVVVDQLDIQDLDKVATFKEERSSENLETDASKSTSTDNATPNEPKKDSLNTENNNSQSQKSDKENNKNILPPAPVVAPAEAGCLSFAAWHKWLEGKIGREIKAEELKTVQDGVVGFITIGSVTYAVFKGFELLMNSQNGQIIKLRNFIKQYSTATKLFGSLALGGVTAWLITSPEAQTMVGNALKTIITEPKVAGVSVVVACLLACLGR